jgi:hypothetical protein
MSKRSAQKHEKNTQLTKKISVGWRKGAKNEKNVGENDEKRFENNN